MLGCDCSNEGKRVVLVENIEDLSSGISYPSKKAETLHESLNMGEMDWEEVI
jgi:hypothetical protein